VTGWQGWLNRIYSDFYFGWLMQTAQERRDHDDSPLQLS